MIFSCGVIGMLVEYLIDLFSLFDLKSLFVHFFRKYNCPQNHKFEFVRPRNINEKMMLQCMACKKIFNTIQPMLEQIQFMISHRNCCSDQQINAVKIIRSNLNNSRQFPVKNASTSQITTSAAKNPRYSVDLENYR